MVDAKPEEESKPQQPCATPDCSKVATMQCPTCIKMQLEPTFFCGQECFTGFWKFHKMAHKKKEQVVHDQFAHYRFTGPLKKFPYTINGRRKVPFDVKKPDYAVSGQPNKSFQSLCDREVPINNEEQIAACRKAGRIAREAVDIGHAMCKPGVTTEEIDLAIHNHIISRGAYPSCLNYYNFPRSCCTSINEIICHGIPDSRPLEDGDICNIDVTAYVDGHHGDMNETFCVGNVHQRYKDLIKTTYESLMLCIDQCKPGAMYREMGNIIAKHVEPKYSVVKSYTGHGTGRIFHLAPQIPHYRNNKAKGFMKPGHVFTIEPMINMGGYKDFTWADDWTSSTVDGQRSAQFEHTILITEDGCELLTGRLPESPPLEIFNEEENKQIPLNTYPPKKIEDKNEAEKVEKAAENESMKEEN